MYSVSFEMKVDYSDIMMDVETWIKKDGCGYYGWALGEDGDMTVGYYRTGVLFDGSDSIEF